MKLHMKTVLCALAALLLSCATAFAAPKTFVVLPFAVNGPAGYKYLEQSIPSMFVSRLHWDGHFIETGMDSAAAKKAATTDAEAEKARAALNADYVVWGSVTVIGEEASLDVRVRDRQGKNWPKSRETKVSQLIPALKGICDNINAEVFARPQDKGPTATVQPRQAAKVNQMNPEFIYNEDGAKQTYLNPNFRYSGGHEGDETVIRTQQLPYTSVGIEVFDANGDGKKEIFILSEHDLYAYTLEQNRLVQIGTQSIPNVDKPLSLRAIDADHTGRARLIVNTVSADTRDNNGTVYIYSFDGKNFREETKQFGYYMNVAKLPPDYRSVLIGQASDSARFLIPGVYEMVKNGNAYSQGLRLALPDGGNVFNFAYMPGGAAPGDSSKLIMYSMYEKLRVYTSKNSRLSESEEKYSGSSRGVEVSSAMPGLGNGQVLEDYYYIPLRLIPCDLDGDGNYEVLANHPISTASEIFSRYRSFPQSEIESLYWDGSGLNLQWKTRRIKGSVSDYMLTDANDDGITDLVVCVNTHPGALGVKDVKTMLFIYPLDLSQTSAVPLPQDDGK